MLLVDQSSASASRASGVIPGGGCFHFFNDRSVVNVMPAITRMTRLNAHHEMSTPSAYGPPGLDAGNQGRAGSV